MKDLSLDDLIKKDKEQSKQHKIKKPKANNEKTQGRKLIKGRRLIRGPKKNERGKGEKNPRDIRRNRQNRDFKRNKNDQKHQNREKQRANQKRNQKPEIKKQLSKPKQQKPKQEKGRTLKVLGLHPDITNSDLYKLFAGQGALQKCMIEQDNFGRNLPEAIVKYHSGQHAKVAQQKYNNHKVMNSILTVVPYKNIRK